MTAMLLRIVRSAPRPRRLYAAGLLLVFGACCAPLAADNWQGRLQSGAGISVDPQTHRVLRDDGGNARPMWDGVHRLEDGSTIIVRDGIAIPTEQMYRAWKGEVRPRPAFEARFCNQLVRKTCGFDLGCNNSASCLRARSMLSDEARAQQSLPASAGVHPQTEAGERCRTALRDPAFMTCASLESSLGDSRCRDLVDQVCGAERRCAGAGACDAAEQLLRMETEVRLENDDPSAPSSIGRQCVEAMSNDFFVACDAGGSVPKHRR
jgi:hypothetical protein